MVSGKQVEDAVRGNSRLPKKACLVTFDDGWEDNYTIAFPILMRYRVPALIFVTTDYIGTKKRFWHVRLRSVLKQDFIWPCKDGNRLSRWPTKLAGLINSELRLNFSMRGEVANILIERMKSIPMNELESLVSSIEILPNDISDAREGFMLSWEQIYEMSREGISFASHSHSHSILPMLDDDSIRAEFEESVKTMQLNLADSKRMVAYPNGDYDARVIKIAKEVGFVCGFTCQNGINENFRRPFELKRINMREDSGSGFSGKFSPLFYRIELSGIKHALKRALNRSAKASRSGNE
jgi:peptidoglycan/xylan/chitin deacetylase (PgdA/CDA1 family)